MRPRSQQRSQMPTVNLVPMMDVVMTILTFFIIVSMTLTNQQAVNVSLPSRENTPETQNLPDPLIVDLDLQGQLLLNSQPVTEAQVTQQVQTYLAQNPKGAVILKADNRLPYEQVIQRLATLQEIGGQQVSLAIDES